MTEKSGTIGKCFQISARWAAQGRAGESIFKNVGLQQSWRGLVFAIGSCLIRNQLMSCASCGSASASTATAYSVPQSPANKPAAASTPPVANVSPASSAGSDRDHDGDSDGGGIDKVV
jgi:hypothetical protein